MFWCSRYVYFFVLIYFWAISTIPSYGNGRGEISYKVLFKNQIFAPTFITSCNNFIFVYGLSDNSVYKISPSNGKVILTISLHLLLPKMMITAMGCYQNELIYAGIIGTNKKQRLFYNGNFYDPPQNITSNILKLFSNNEELFLLAGDVYETVNLRSFKKLTIPSISKIVKLDQATKEDNPFSGMQEDMMISGGKYVDGVFLAGQEFFLLDVFYGQVVTYSDWGKGSFTIEKFKKFGKRGGNEGELLYPRGITVLDKFQKVVISDVGVKVLFFFSKDGKYLGWIGTSQGEKNNRFDYPIDVTSIDDTIWVADFLSNIVYAIKITEIKEREASVGVPKIENIDDYLHRNLLRDSKVVSLFEKTRCMSCHDGVERFDLNKFIALKHYHPIGIGLAEKVDLPLNRKNEVACYTCHDSHHPSALNTTANKRFPYMLRKKSKELCLTCHTDKADISTNHLNLKLTLTANNVLIGDDIKVETCTQCHSMHAAEGNLVHLKDEKLCLTCHKESRRPTNHPFGEDTEIQCLSCHLLHGGQKSENFARRDKDGSVCLSCHRELGPYAGKNKHLDMKKYKKDPSIKWTDLEFSCISCHNPHDDETHKYSKVSDLCIKCHQTKEEDVHRGKNIVAFTKRAAKLRFETSKIACLTCHEHHGLSENESFLKNKTDLLEFCSSCHAEKATRLFSDFHKLAKKVIK